MESRSEKYNQSMTRSSKNKQLYDDLYNDTNYSNMVVIDDSNEIDINKIKELIDKDKRPTREINNNYMYSSLDEYYKIDKKEEKKKSYDINEVLKEAKNKRNIIEEANEKRKIENYKFKNNLDLENELAKTRKVYNDLVKEETELLNIMNTLSNIDINSNKKIEETTSLALDLLEDFKEENDRKERLLDRELSQTKTAPIVKKVKERDLEESNEYSTDTFMFDTRDFEGLKNVKEELKKSSIISKIFIFIFTVFVVIACYYVITKYIIK